VSCSDREGIADAAGERITGPGGRRSRGARFGSNGGCGSAVRLLALALSLGGVGCAPPERNFSQYPGFREFRARSAADTRDADALELLERFRPRFFLAPGQEPPIDFYRDYIAQGVLLDGDGRILSEQVDAAVLNAHKDDPRVVFEHRDRGIRGMPRAMVRLEHRRLRIGKRTLDWSFLTYTLVFRYSGLPAGLPLWKRWPLRLVGDTRRWHPLDHYTAATIVLDDQNQVIALMLQQHNYQTTYVVGLDIRRPADQRLPVDVAIDSNELYPHRGQRTRHRAVSFLSPEALDYLLTGEDPPFLSADDVTDGRFEVEYALEPLPADDAFYVFQGWLGRRSGIPGRDAPPGAAYNTIPSLKSPLTLLSVNYRWPERDAYRAQMRRLWNALPAPGGVLPPRRLLPFHRRFLDALAQAGVLDEAGGAN